MNTNTSNQAPPAQQPTGSSQDQPVGGDKCDLLGHDWKLIESSPGSGYFKCKRCGATG